MNRVLFSIGPITIYWYSVTMLIAILTGIYLSLKEAKRQNKDSFISDLIIYVIIFGIIGARLYYVIFNFNDYKYNILSIFEIWEGGIAIYGAIIAGFLTIVYLSKKNNQSIINTTDIIAPGLILAQSIGRWGNFFNQEAHGIATTKEFLQNIHIPKFIIEGMKIDGIYYHPTFLYESIWCLLGFILLILLRKLTKRKKGIMTFSYFIWYGIGRVIIEGLRTDSLYIGNYRISQIVSIVLILSGIIGIILSIVKGNKNETKI